MEQGITAYIGSAGIVSGEDLGLTNQDAKAGSIAAFYNQIASIAQDMWAAGFPKNLVTTYCIAQIRFESNYLTSHVAHIDNNYTGIKYLNKPYQNATKGIPSPEGGNYAHYATFADFLQDYKRILSINGPAGRPIDATSAAQFGQALKANHYFTDPNYFVKFNAALRKVNDALNWGEKQDKQFLQQYNQGQDTFTYTPGKGLTSNAAFSLDKWWTNMKLWAHDHPVAATATGAGIIITLVALLRR